MNETFYKEFGGQRACSYPRVRQFELVITLQGCTTLPTRRKDHATHPTDHAGQGGTHVNRSQQGSIIEIFTPSLRVET